MVKAIVITLLITVLLVSIAGYLFSGFTSTSPTLAVEGAPKVDISEALQGEGWQLHYANDKDVSQGYDAIRAVFSIDDEAIHKYEAQGYKVEVGIIMGIGMNNDTGVRYNNVKDLAVVEKGGELVAKREHSDVTLIYSSDETVETNGFFDTWEYGSDVRRAFRAEVELDPSMPNANTHVAAAFIRLTGSMGTKTEYCFIREVMSVKPLVFGAVVNN